MSTEVELPIEGEDMGTSWTNPNVKVGPKKSNGVIFKEKYGISKTLKRNMSRKKLDWEDEGAIKQYKELRKARKKKELKNKQEKHTTVKANRKAKATSTKK